MIQLGLQRISRLLDFRTTADAVHVAGTNGKGSICAYTSAALIASGLRVGKFTSPHLIHRRDCISINNEPVSEQVFRSATACVQDLNLQEDIQATPFEILTATAFRIFADEKCTANVIECGMGGGNDATNAYPPLKKLVTVIAKVGLDHQEFLGNDIEDIAKEKCGIFHDHVPVVFDTSNKASVLRVIRQEAQMSNAYIAHPWHKSAFCSGRLDEDFSEENVVAYFKNSPIGVVPYQVANAAIAFRAAYTFLDRRSWFLSTNKRNPNAPQMPQQPDPQLLLNAISKTTVPGRYQTVNLEPLLNLKRSIILDGAHNAQAIQAVAPALATLRRNSPSGKITWIVAFSEGKALDEMLAPIIRPGDNIAAVTFGPVDGMPWKQAMPSSEIVECCDSLRAAGLYVKVEDFGPNIMGALRWASSVLGVPMVGIGSLYLISDILRLLETKTSRKY